MESVLVAAAAGFACVCAVAIDCILHPALSACGWPDGVWRFNTPIAFMRDYEGRMGLNEGITIDLYIEK
jgi:hypothetical protein